MKRDSSAKTPNSREFNNVVHDFIESFFPERTRLSWQYGYPDNPKKDMAYYPTEDKISEGMLRLHFYEGPRKVNQNPGVRGSLATTVTAKTRGILKFICFDFDDKKSTDESEHLLKKFDELGIEYLKELGGDDLERSHIWIKVDNLKKTALYDFVYQVIFESFEEFKTLDHIRQSKMFKEIFGINKPDSLIRIPLGPHLRRGGRRFPLFIDGNLSDDPVEFMKAWIKLKPITQEFIDKTLPLLKKAPINELERGTTFSPEKQKMGSKSYVYKPLDLPLPFPVPKYMKDASSNCQAINKLLWEIESDQVLEERGGHPHLLGVYLAGMASYSDYMSSVNEGFLVTEGKEWLEFIKSHKRIRDAKSHNWDWVTPKMTETNYFQKFASCARWDENFGLCGGCPFKGKIVTPRRFDDANKSIVRIEGEEIIGKDFKEIRETTFEEFEKVLVASIINREKKSFLINSPPGAGKSFKTDQIISRLTKLGKRSLLAVPTTQIRTEHKDRLKKEFDTHSFSLDSHRSIFSEENNISPFECPEYDAIQEYLDKGLPSRVPKAKYCKKCPLADGCYYPTQFRQMKEQHHENIIIQHAHFLTPEVSHDLMAKNFNVLFVDESFMNSIYENIKITKVEIKVLEIFKDTYPWVKKIYDWIMLKNQSDGDLDYTIEEVNTIANFIKQRQTDMRLGDIIRFYTSKKLISRDHVIEAVHDLTDVPIKVYTDATAPEDILRALNGPEPFQTFGKNEVLDIKKLHPENEIIQLLDYSCSVKKLEGPGELEKFLFAIGDFIELKYPNKKILITAYAKLHDKIKKFFKEHKEEYPTVLDRTTIYQMEKGTNRHLDVDVQFILGARYMYPAEMVKEANKYKTIINHYNTRYNKDTFPLFNKRKIPVWAKNPLERIEYCKDGKIRKVTYPKWKPFTYPDKWFHMVDECNKSVSDQAVRLRFLPDKPRHVYLLSNVFMKNWAVTCSLTTDQFLKSALSLLELPAGQ